MYYYTYIVDAAPMGRKRNTIPSHLLHVTSGQSYVRWDGEFYYTGIQGTPAADTKYLEYCQNIAHYGHPLPPKPAEAISVADLAARYHAHVVKTKPPESQEDKPVGRAMKSLAAVSGPAEKFSPAKLVALRQEWVDAGLSVSTIAKKHNYILNAFRWAAQMDLVPSTVWTSLQTVQKLKPGRSACKQPRKVHPVDRATIDAVLPQLTPDIAALVEFQWLTGCRSAEALNITLAEIRDGVYSPVKHKNAFRGKTRSIHLGPQARKLVAKWATDNVHAPLFATINSAEYGKRIKRACKRAKVAHFSPHQIRHAHGTIVRDKFGLDAAQAALGHSSARTTEIYAEVSKGLARKISDEIG